MSLIPVTVEKKFNNLLDRVVPLISLSKICPNFISTAGCCSNLVAAFLLINGHFGVAGLFILLGGLLDMLDGKLARLTRQVTVYGAVYDATMDRIGELALYTGIGGYLVLHHMYLTAFVAVVATGGSLLISYVRARAESYNVHCTIGLLRRAERILLLGFGSIVNVLHTVSAKPLRDMIVMLHVPHKFIPMPITIALLAIAILSPLTVAQRLLYIKKSGSSLG